MPGGPFLTTVLTNTASPLPTASDPPQTSMVVVAPGSLSLAPRKWEQTTGDTNVNTGFDNAATKTGITVSSSSVYVNGNQYITGVGHFNTTPTNADIYNGGFETVPGPTQSGTGTNPASGSTAGWAVTALNGAGEVGGTNTITEITGGKASAQGIVPQAGTRMGYVRVSSNGNFGALGTQSLIAAAQIVDTTNSNILFNRVLFSKASGGLVSFTQSGDAGLAWNSYTFPTSALAVGRACRLRVIIQKFSTAPDWYAYFLSDAFVWSGSVGMTLRHWIQFNVNNNGTMDLAVDSIVGGRADYRSTNEFISQEIRTPGYSTTQEAVNKVWYRVCVDMDIPVGTSAVTSPTRVGHGASVDMYVRTGATTGLAYAAMDAQTQLITTYTTEGMNQGGGTYNTGTGALNISIDSTPAMTTRPFMRFRFVLNSGVAAPSATVNTGTVSPVIKAVRVYFFNADANYYWSQQRDLGSGAGAFSNFNAASTNSTPAATISYSMRAAATGSLLNTAAWSAVTPGSVPGLAFARYIEWAARIQPVASADSLPAITAVSVGYLNSGELASAPPAAAWSDKRYYLQVQERNRSFNNRTWMLDTNGAWSKHDRINASCFAVFKGRLLIGHLRTSGGAANLTLGRVQILDGISESDDGEVIPWYIKTRDFKSPDLRSPIAVRGLEVVGRATAPTTYPTVGSGLSGFAYNVMPATWIADLVISGVSGITQQINMSGSGQETGFAAFSPDKWGSTVGVIISGLDINKRSQIDSITVNIWSKEPANR